MSTTASLLTRDSSQRLAILSSPPGPGDTPFDTWRPDVLDDAVFDSDPRRAVYDFCVHLAATVFPECVDELDADRRIEAAVDAHWPDGIEESQTELEYRASEARGLCRTAALGLAYRWSAAHFHEAGVLLLKPDALEDAFLGYDAAIAEPIPSLDPYAVFPEAHRERFRASDAKLAESASAQHEAAVAVQMAYLRARNDAERRIAAETYDGLGELMEWDALVDEAEANWLVSGLVGVGDTCLLVGKRNLGKSFFAYSLGFSVAAGLEFTGRATQQGPVLFILGEGTRGFMARLTAWATVNGVPLSLMRDKVAVYKGGNLSNDTSLADLKRAAAGNPALVVLDTYSSLSGVPDEDKAAVNAEIINRVKGIAPSATKLILHHPTKSSEDTDAPIARGSGTITANVDTVITMFRDRHYNVQGMPGDTWLAASTEEDHQGKQRDGKRITLRGLRIVSEGDSAILDHHAGETLSKHDQWVITNLSIGELVTVKQLEDKLSLSGNTVRTHLRNSRLVVEAISANGGANEYTRTA